MLRRSGGCSGFRCPYGCLDVQLAKAILSLECAHALLESRYRRITAHSITDVLTCVPPDLGLQSTWLLTSFFQESISADILYRKSMVRNSASSLSLLLFPMLLLVFATSDIRKAVCATSWFVMVITPSLMDMVGWTSVKDGGRVNSRSDK